MNERDTEQKFAAAMSKAVPDMLGRILRDLPAQERPSHKRRAPFRQFAAIAAAFVALIGGAVGISRYQSANAIAAIVGIDVNPSIELRLNSASEVLQAEAMNSDAATVLGDMKLEGVDVNVAVNAIIGSMLRTGYITDLANSLLLTVENDDAAAAQALQTQLVNEISGLFSVTSVQGALLSQAFAPSDDMRAKAAEYGISEGKAALITTLLKSAPTHTFEELAKLSINELTLLSSGSVSAPDSPLIASGEASDKAYIGYDAAKAAALNAAGAAAQEVNSLSAELDCDDGRMVYEVEFILNGMEYEIELDAATGKVLSFEAPEPADSFKNERYDVDEPDDDNDYDDHNDEPDDDEPDDDDSDDDEPDDDDSDDDEPDDDEPDDDEPDDDDSDDDEPDDND